MTGTTSKTFCLRPLLVAILLTAGLFAAGLGRIRIDTDITRSLPGNDPVISDATEIFSNHPTHDQMAIDVSLQEVDADLLIQCGEWIEGRLEESGLFGDVGMKETGSLIPRLMFHIADDLPVMFTKKELDEKVGPLLEPAEIHRRMEQVYTTLLNMEGVGQAGFIEQDPLGLKDIVAAKLAQLIPSEGALFYRGHVISSDQRHLLVTATPKTSGTDTAFARQATALMGRLAEGANQRFGGPGREVILTPVGAYRAALDNELIARRDVTTALVLATTGIALLLLVAFPRPLVGLLSLLPALAGTAIAFFVYSLFHKSISIMVLGFGGAIVSITVDHSIAYLLFLDGPQQRTGRQASREAWAVGHLAVFTTVGAFGALSLSGFPILEELGQFTALGVLFSVAFVHVVFPLVFPAARQGPSKVMPLQHMVDRLAMGGKPGAWAALLFFAVMLLFAKPEFNVSLSSMNTVSKATAAAEELFSRVWGDMGGKVFVMTEAESLKGLQSHADRLLAQVEEDLASGAIASAFVPSMVFPGEERRHENLAAWIGFWNPDRVAGLKEALGKTGSEFDFAPHAFDPFYKLLTPSGGTAGAAAIPQEYFKLLGIAKESGGSKWLQFSSLTTGTNYDPEKLFGEYRVFGKVFNPTFFSKRLGGLLFATFEKMLVVVGAGVALLLFFVFLDLRLTLVSLVPVVFAFISALGTLKLIGHPLDLPALMLSIVVLGMGVDYSLFFVRSYQRYGNASELSSGPVRMTVFMAAASTIIGFGVLSSAQHTLLRSAGITSLLGIGYSLAGAFLILPPVLTRIFRSREEDAGGGPGSLQDRVRRRYRNLEPYPRLFARFKMLLDPMFPELDGLLGPCPSIRTVLDVGSGYGVPAAWLLERCPDARIYGVEPDGERVRVAAMAVGKRGVMTQGRAPDIPAPAEAADVALMLDMAHYLDDAGLNRTLGSLLNRLQRDGRLIIRVCIPPKGRPSWSWRIEGIKLALSKTPVHYRPVEEIRALIAQAGFRIEAAFPSGSNQELFWIVARPGRLREAGQDDKS
jgi:predicted exporter/SAM-dependent methyltransferase